MYFKEYPFRVIPEQETKIWADRSHLKKELNEFIEDFYKNSNSKIKCIWGDFGSGKSHSLMYLKTIFKEKNYGEFIYSPFPKQSKNFSDIFKQSFFSNLNFFSLARSCQRLYEHVKNSKNEFEEYERIQSSLFDGWADFMKLMYDAGELFKRLGVQAMKEPYIIIIRQWLSGQKLSKSDLKKLGIMHSLENDSDYVKTFGCIIRILTSEFNDRQLVVWALDDSQFLGTLDSKSKNLIQQGLRDAFDASRKGLCLIISISKRNPKLDEILIEDLRSRMSPSSLELMQLSEKDATIFVKDLINDKRYKLDEKKNEWYPFEQKSVEEAINSIKEIEDLIPRNIMNYFDDIVTLASNKKLDKIDIEFVKDYFKKIKEEA